MRMDEETTVLVAVGVASILVLATVVYITLQPKPAKEFMEMYVLDSNHGTVDYVRDLEVNEVVRSYVGVRNYMNSAQYMAIYVKISNNTVSAEPCPLPPLVTYERILPKGATWEFPLDIVLTRAEIQGGYTVVKELRVNNMTLRGLGLLAEGGKGYRVVFELWLYDPTSESFKFTGSWGKVWTQFWFNLMVPK